jgi:hypothetical protein
MRIKYAWRNPPGKVLLHGRKRDGKLALKCALEKYVMKMGGVKGGYTLVTLPRIVTPYRDSVDKTHDHVTYQKLGYAVTLRACSVCCRYLAAASKGRYGYGPRRCGRAT